MHARVHTYAVTVGLVLTLCLPVVSADPQTWPWPPLGCATTVQVAESTPTHARRSLTDAMGNLQSAV